MASDSSATLPRPERPTARTTAELAAYLGVDLPPAAHGRAITGIAQGSRQVRAGDVFVARPGARSHGADFAAQAVQAGAVVAVTDAAGTDRCERAGLPALVVADPGAVLGRLAAWVYGHPGADLTLLAVTGTNGKTTVSYLVDAALRASGRRTGLVGTVETRVADEVVPSHRSTPEAPELHGLFARMRERGVTAACMEASSQAIWLGRVDGVYFQAAAFTNLSQDHLEVHGDLESYFQAKAALFDTDRVGRAVINVDDDHGARLAVQTNTRVVRVSPSGRGDADWSAGEVRRHGAGTTFTAHGPEGLEVAVRVAMPGGFNVENALVALALATAVEVDPHVAARGIAAASVPGRMERVTGGGREAVVDYAHTPEAVSTVLQAARPGVVGRLIVVFGCGGDRDTGKRALMGAAAARCADVVVVTDDNPRSEDPAVIRAAIRAGVDHVRSDERAEVVEVPGRREAIAYAVELATPQDLVLVLGKGHERGQEIAGVVHEFDDRAVLSVVLGETASTSTTTKEASR